MRFLFIIIAALFFSNSAFAQTLPTFRDCSVASATGSSQALLAGTNYQRKYLLVCNNGSSNSVGVNFAGGTAAIGGAGTITLPTSGGAAAQCKEFGVGSLLPLPPGNIVTAIGTSGQPILCIEGK